MGYLRKNGDGSLLYSVVNTAEPDADGEWALEGLGFSEAHMLLSPSLHCQGFCLRSAFPLQSVAPMVEHR